MAAVDNAKKFAGSAFVTPLGQRIRTMIADNGPISIEQYMGLCLADPAHGYYMTRDPIGADGDFTTAPEISQMFGEMIGVWLVNVWQAMGAPVLFHLVELGPGRGTLMTDILRTAKIAPDFLSAAQIHLVETSPVLRARQQQVLQPFLGRAHWHDAFASVPEGPLLVVANEFFDALPIRQWQRIGSQWFERMVSLDTQGQLQSALHTEPDAKINLTAGENAVLERCLAGEKIMAALAARLAQHGGAALLIDYGHMHSGVGDTLQAIRRHAFADIFAEPGEADLTAHVDFARLKAIAEKNGVHTAGPVTQGVFLRGLGIEPRAHALAMRASEEQRADIRAALQRLTGVDDNGMGELFKVMAVTHPQLPPPPGF